MCRHDHRCRKIRGCNEFHHVIDILLDGVRLRDRGGPVGSVWAGVGPVVGADAGRLRDGGLRGRRARPEVGLADDVVGRRPDRVVGRHDDVPHLGVAAFAGDDEHHWRPAALAVQVKRAAIADVDQPGEVLVMRFRRATGDNSERQDKPEQGLHLPDDTTDASTNTGRTCSSSRCDEQDVHPRRAGRGVRELRGRRSTAPRRPATGIPGLSSTAPTSFTSSTRRAPCAAAKRCGPGSGRPWRPFPAAI